MMSFNKLIKNDLTKLNNIIIQDLNSDIPFINEVCNYIISAGGKRIRPILTILIAKALEYDNELIYKMAAMIEYIHTATLIHDDIVDSSEVRRNRKTSNKMFGNAASVLVGDFIYTRAFEMMIDSGSLRLLKIMAQSTNKISEGEILQLLNIANNNLTEQEYFAVIEYKTATLFKASALVATILANAPTDTELALIEYANYLGTAFQIIDDILDYTGNAKELGKNIGDDILEGKLTLPLIYTIQNDSKNSEFIKNIISNSNLVNQDTIGKIIQIVNNNNAIIYSKNIATKLIDNAIKKLEVLKNSKYKSALHFIASESIKRTK